MPERRPPGRPSKITTVVATAPDGTPVTAGEHIAALIRAGNYVETAASAAGIDKTAVYEWLKVSAGAHGKVHRGERTTSHERRCMDFANAVSKAEAESEAEDVARLATLARGGLETRTITVKVDKDGNELERTVRTDQLAPSDRVLMWRLERRFSKRWGQRGSLEVTGLDGGALELDLGESARSALGDVLGLMAERLAGVELVQPGAVVDEASPLLVATEERPDARVQAEPPTE